MKLKVNENKSASNVENEETFGNKLEEIEEIEGYKYLGILEDSKSIIKEENKQILEERMLKRLEKLCQSKLNAVNLSKGINEYAISIYNYYITLRTKGV